MKITHKTRPNPNFSNFFSLNLCVVLLFLCSEVSGKESVASKELFVGNTPSAHDDTKTAETEKLVKALASSECSVRWEGVKEAVSSWEQAFYLYPEIERRTNLEPVKDQSYRKLLLIKTFIRDEIVAMTYRETLDTRLQDAKSAGRNHKLQVLKELETIIRSPYEIFLKRMFSLNVSADLSVGPTLREYILGRDRNVGLVASNVAVMRDGYAELDKPMLAVIKQTLLDGLMNESFAERYFSLRSLEKLSAQEDSAGCVDPTDTPGKTKTLN